MSQTLFIIKGTHQGNRMGDPDNITYTEEFVETKIKSLNIFCEKVIDALENFEDASNFQEEVEKIKPQLEVYNFAQLNFEYPSSRYKITIVPPKFE
jgi:hypothetical protein